MVDKAKVKEKVEPQLEVVGCEWPLVDLRFGQRSPDVAELQERLAAYGWFQGRRADGFYSMTTVTAVSRLQRAVQAEGAYEGPIDGQYNADVQAAACAVFPGAPDE